MFFFFPLLTRGSWESSCAGCFYLAKPARVYGVERNSIWIEEACGCHQDRKVERQLTSNRRTWVREYQQTLEKASTKSEKTLRESK